MTGSQLALGKVRHSDGSVRVVVMKGNSARLVSPPSGKEPGFSTILHSGHADRLAEELYDRSDENVPINDLSWLAPIDRQEVWAAGVTYLRSSEARQRESQGAAAFYDKVYMAARPELFLKATANRVKGPGEEVRFRSDSSWSVPEPEFALVIDPAGRIVGLTIGNDMSARDIEGENPLYLPQAKVYSGACSLGPRVILAPSFASPDRWRLSINIHRSGREVFSGNTGMDRMKRSPEELVGWLTRELEYPEGVILLTGTGIVPPDEFTLERGDVVSIHLGEMMTLTNPVGC